MQIVINITNMYNVETPHQQTQALLKKSVLNKIFVNKHLPHEH